MFVAPSAGRWLPGRRCSCTQGEVADWTSLCAAWQQSVTSHGSTSPAQSKNRNHQSTFLLLSFPLPHLFWVLVSFFVCLKLPWPELEKRSAIRFCLFIRDYNKHILTFFFFYLQRQSFSNPCRYFPTCTPFEPKFWDLWHHLYSHKLLHIHIYTDINAHTHTHTHTHIHKYRLNWRWNWH